MGKPWFGVKRYGVGLAPCSVEGWLAVAAYVVAMAATAPIVNALHLPIWFIGIGFLIATAALLGLVAVKNDGKPWHWRWGNDRSDS
jgi:hypothetical protein